MSNGCCSLVVEELRKILVALWQGNKTAISPESLFSVIWKVVPRFRYKASSSKPQPLWSLLSLSPSPPSPSLLVFVCSVFLYLPFSTFPLHFSPSSPPPPHGSPVSAISHSLVDRLTPIALSLTPRSRLTFQRAIWHQWKLGLLCYYLWAADLASFCGIFNLMLWQSPDF